MSFIYDLKSVSTEVKTSSTKEVYLDVQITTDLTQSTGVYITRLPSCPLLTLSTEEEQIKKRAAGSEQRTGSLSLVSD